MKFIANIPIFIQIKEYYQRLIELGVINSGEFLPSVRDVSLQNNVNPNTVQKAFSLLINEGYLTPIIGKGNVVNELNKKARQDDHLRSMLVAIKEAGYSKVEILKALEQWED